MDTALKIIFAIKIVGAVLFVVVIAIGIVYTMATGAQDPETTHGYTAVCGDGTVLPPPWNSCGAEHDYLNHWTTSPTGTLEP